MVFAKVNLPDGKIPHYVEGIDPGLDRDAEFLPPPESSSKQKAARLRALQEVWWEKQRIGWTLRILEKFTEGLTLQSLAALDLMLLRDRLKQIPAFATLQKSETYESGSSYQVKKPCKFEKDDRRYYRYSGTCVKFDRPIEGQFHGWIVCDDGETVTLNIRDPENDGKTTFYELKEIQVSFESIVWRIPNGL